MKKKQTIVNRNPLTWVKDAWLLAKPYWISDDKYKALSLIAVIILFNFLMVGMAVLVNQWYKNLYTAIQHYDRAQFIHLIIKFCGLAALNILFAILAYYFRKILEIRWRKWLTHYYLDDWLQDKAYYKTRFLPQIIDNPDQRLSEDINAFIILCLDLTLGLITSLVTLASFFMILWHLSGDWKFSLGTQTVVVIHGYMVWVAFIYAVVGTYVTFKIGKPLIKLDFQQQAYEADFRFNLMRVREYGENIAFYDGESREKDGLTTNFNKLVNNFVAIIYRQLKIDIFGVGYKQIALIFPLVIAAPRYFAKTISLGDLMQISSAFGRVQDALSYFIGAYSSLSGWRAVMDRLYGFQLAIADANKLDTIVKQPGPSYLQIKNLTICLPTLETLTQPITITLNSGDRLLIKGCSGSGKTTLLRTLAGLWHFASGEIYQQPRLTSLFIAQKPYLPIGSLKSALCYPQTNTLPSDAELNALLKGCNLSHLIPQLLEDADWANILSLGEQQRIAFCRILITKPNLIYLDEATSALDEETEELFYQTLIKSLPASVIVSIGHRSTIRKWHNQELNFNHLTARAS
ncbi:MAG: ABC transporter ATP-binding protein/permease [Burkholderiales bacterium]